MPESLDPNSIMKLLKKASSFDIFLISFLALPFVFKAWLEIAEKLSLSDEGKSVVLVVVAVFYAAGMIAMYRGNSRAREREIARDQIIGYLTSKGRTIMSYERIRKNVNSTYSDAFLETLPINFPDALRRARLKGAKPGLARIEASEVDDEG